MERPRITVTRDHLETTLAVWLTTVPPHIWQRYIRWEKLRAEKRDTEADRVDVRSEIAKHLAGKAEQAHWEMSYPEPPPQLSPPPWRGNR